jgi:hypothetical protein
MGKLRTRQLLSDLSEQLFEQFNADEKEQESIYKTDASKTKSQQKKMLSTGKHASLERDSQQPHFVNTRSLRKWYSKRTQMKGLEDYMRRQSLDNPAQEDEDFTLLMNEREDIVASLQDGIGASNEYSKKFNVIKSREKLGEPSLDLSQRASNNPFTI